MKRSLSFFYPLSGEETIMKRSLSFFYPLSGEETIMKRSLSFFYPLSGEETIMKRSLSFFYPLSGEETIMKRSLSFFYALIILWALPADGQDGLLGTWEVVEEGGIEVTSVEEDGTLHRQTLEGETSLRATFVEDNSCQFDIKMRFYNVAMSQVLFGGGADEVNLVRLVEIATAVDLVTDDQLDTWRQRVDDALARLHADSMTLSWMGTYSAEGNSLQIDFDEGALYLGDIEAVEFFINFFAEELGSDELSDDLVEWITSIFGGTTERGWTIAANISSDSGNLVFSFPGPDGTFPGPDGTANTLELARVPGPTAVAPISWGDLKDRW